MHQSIRRLAIAAIAAIAAAVLVGGLAAPAAAGSATKKSNTDTYSSTYTVAFPENGECVRYTLDGKVTYTAVRGPKSIGSSLRSYWLRDIKLRSPRLRAATVRYDSSKHACTGTSAKYKKLTLRQIYSGYSCSFNPSIAVSVPWGVSVSGWPSCGNKKAAMYTSSFTRGRRATQLRTDSKVSFAPYAYSGERSSAPRTGPCYGGIAKMALRTGSVSSTKSGPRARICLTPSFK